MKLRRLRRFREHCSYPQIDIIYKINAQSYNNWCSNSPAGTAQFFEDVATTWIEACPSTGYLGLENHADVFGLGVLAANKDGDGYAAPSIVTQALTSIGTSYGTYNGMFWDTLTDLGNNWIISKGIAAAAPEDSSAPTVTPTLKPTAPTAKPTEKDAGSESFVESDAFIGLMVGVGAVTAVAASFFAYKACNSLHSPHQENGYQALNHA